MIKMQIITDWIFLISLLTDLLRAMAKRKTVIPFCLRVRSFVRISFQGQWMSDGQLMFRRSAGQNNDDDDDHCHSLVFWHSTKENEIGGEGEGWVRKRERERSTMTIGLVESKFRLSERSKRLWSTFEHHLSATKSARCSNTKKRGGRRRSSVSSWSNEGLGSISTAVNIVFSISQGSLIRSFVRSSERRERGKSIARLFVDVTSSWCSTSTRVHTDSCSHSKVNEKLRWI